MAEIKDQPKPPLGNSGIGNYHGAAGFKAFSQYKSILERVFTADPDVRYSPHPEGKLKMLRSLV